MMAFPPPLISIGLLAWNEENSIGTTLTSLRGQTLLACARRGECRVEIVVVPNGCTDKTAEVARTSLAEITHEFPSVSVAVEVLEEGSKTRAWNHFVHRASQPETEFFLLMDADIELLTPETLERMWQTLRDHPEAVVATDLPVKHVARKARLSLQDRLLLGVGAMTRATPGQLTGQLYCARAAVLRRVVIPIGLIVEDGYLKQILCTDGFSHPVDNSRIVRAEGASHVFECYTRWRDIWNHQVRQALGHTLFTYLTHYVRTRIPERPAFATLAGLCREDPEWFVRFVREEVRRRGWWVMDTPSLTMRWRRAFRARGLPQLKFLLLAALASPYDLLVFATANRRLRTGQVKGVWKDTRTSALSSS
jgi:glycosyltransferase involved in cell wall biosynthesis